MQRRFLVLGAPLAALLVACGGGGGQSVAVDDGPTEVEVEVEATEEEQAGGGLDAVEAAAIQIVAEGSFVDPEVGEQLNAAGAGSGIIIDESGIAVTNNHVVTGAALLEVYVNGEDDPKNAKVLGVSECSDLAVIDIEGDGYPFLPWYEDEIDTGLEVYAAGFPLGDPEYTLTRGIVSKADADGETNWASVDSVIEHDATINPGNSGGALVTPEGQIVGINYAGSSETNQYYAITRAEAEEVLDTLQGGEDHTSIGVNGEAVNDGEGLSGIWVASVKSGSPADKAGIRGGDIITKMEGLVLATDGTMSDYCDILRSRNADDVLSVEVLRFATEEVLEGQLNGRPLEQSFSFATELAEETTNADEVDVEGVEDGAYGDYVSISDATGAIEVEVPASWSDVNGDALDGALPALQASPNNQEFDETWNVPGVIVAATSEAAGADPEALLDEFAPEDCTSTGREDYDDGVYTGRFELFESCGGTETKSLNIVAQPEDSSFVVFVNVQIVSDADLAAVDKIIETFQVVGEV